MTKLERQALQGIINSEFHDGSHPVGSPVWSWSCNPFERESTFGGVVASLVKKGWVISDGNGPDACLMLTQAGYDAAMRD